MDNTMKNLVEKQPRLVNRDRRILLNDNVHPLTANRIQLKLPELDFETIDHPPYSPDLSLTDYHLFQNLDNFLREKIFFTVPQSKILVKSLLSMFPNRPSKIPSALSFVLALQTPMQKA